MVSVRHMRDAIDRLVCDVERLRRTGNPEYEPLITARLASIRRLSAAITG